MRLTPPQQRKLDKKLDYLQKCQKKALRDDIERLGLKKSGDTRWTRYVAKMMRRLRKSYEKEFRLSRYWYIKEIINSYNI